jgi:hypothetical protein
MVNQTDLDLHYAEHIARNARVVHHGWKTEGMASLETQQDRSEATFVERMRRRLSQMLIGAGERLNGTPADHVKTAIEIGY